MTTDNSDYYQEFIQLMDEYKLSYARTAKLLSCSESSIKAYRLPATSKTHRRVLKRTLDLLKAKVRSIKKPIAIIVCPECKGRRYISAKEQCPRCKGQGVFRDKV